MSFFPSLELRDTQKPQGLLLPKCDACGLYKTCKSPKMSVDGKGSRKVLIVGESPGKNEDLQGKPFIGAAGQVLQTILRKIGVDLRRDCWITNSLICHPVDDIINSDKMIGYCRPNIIKTIKELQPETIILLGARAVESVIGWLWKPSPGGVFRWAGFQCPVREINTWICPTFHPAAMLHAKDPRVMQLLFEQHLADAFSLEGRPYDQVPDLSRRIKLIMDPEEASHSIHRLIDAKRAISFDYETSHLRAESLDSAILCCSVSDGSCSIAFPWTGKAIESMRELLTSKLKKIAWNMKFEDQWSRTKLKIKVNNWYWDGMLTSHGLDNRKDICSLKFQAFARLGYKDYDSKIDPYKNGDGPHGRNRLHELPLKDLLLYCGQDALFTFELAQLQCREVGLKL